MPTRIITTIDQPEYGVEVVVAEIDTGFSIGVRDTDSGHMVPAVWVFKTEAEAMQAVERFIRRTIG